MDLRCNDTDFILDVLDFLETRLLYSVRICNAIQLQPSDQERKISAKAIPASALGAY